MKFKWNKYYTYGITIVFLLIPIVYAALHVDITFKVDQAKPMVAQVPSPPVVEKGLAELPQESHFQEVAQTEDLVLMADSATAHFIVRDKRNGNVFYSYPDPAQWESETQAGSWRYHLRAPLIVEYMDFGKPNSLPKLTSFVAQDGKVEQFQKIGGGFSLTLDMPSIGISVPIEVTLKDDYVQTKIVDSKVKEVSPRLISMRLYPFFGAEHSMRDQPGYMLIPDGSGALIDFKPTEFASNQIYDQKVFGDDIAFSINNEISNMLSIKMPVFGMKSGNKGFLAVIDQGAPYSRIQASPAGVYSGYNWTTVQQIYRDKFRMVLDKNKPTSGFITYNIDHRYIGDRTVRYYMLNSGDNGYVAMASKFRQYLMESKGLTKMTTSKDIPLNLAIIGAGTKDGFISNQTIKETTTSQAMQMVQRLYGLGVKNMSVSYWGWQNGGYGEYGGNFPVDSWVGGNNGMKDFVDFAHSLQIPVYLNIDYGINTTGQDGFNSRNEGARDLSGTLLKFNDNALVSTKFANKVLTKDLPKYKALGVDGLELQITGKFLNSDYNTKYGGVRLEVEQAQIEMLKNIKAALGSVRGDALNMYALGEADHISNLPNDYSHNIFSTRSVPFTQIALHGLISYTSDFINNHEQYQEDLLKDIEYGYNPSFNLTWQPNNLKYSFGLNKFYSTQYENWEEQIVMEYQRFNEALGDVQDQFIVNHKQLTPQVYQTTYENGQSVIVNYGDRPYAAGQVNVQPQAFTVIKGGDVK